MGFASLPVLAPSVEHRTQSAETSKGGQVCPKWDDDVIGRSQSRPVDGTKVGANIHQNYRCFHVRSSLLHQAMEPGLHSE